MNTKSDGLIAMSDNGTTAFYLSNGDITVTYEDDTFDLQGHTTAVNVCVISDNHLLSCSKDDTNIRVWDLKTRECVKILRCDSPVVCATFSSCGTKILSGSGHHNVQLWDINLGRCIKTFEMENIGNGYENDNSLTSVSMSSSGKYVATGSFNGNVRIWDTATEKLLRTFNENIKSVRKCTFHGDEEISICCCDGSYRKWNIDSGDRVSAIDDSSCNHSVNMMLTSALVIHQSCLCDSITEKRILYTNSLEGVDEDTF